MKPPTIEEQIAEAHEQINIGKIQAAMTAMNWIWYPEEKVPTKERIRKTLDTLIRHVVEAKEKSRPGFSPSASTGGFHVMWNGKEETLHIFFAVEHYEWMA